MRKDEALQRAIGEVIREERDKKGWSQRALSSKLEEHATYVYDIEAGQHQVKVWEFVVIAETLGCDPTKLFVRALKRARSGF